MIELNEQQKIMLPAIYKVITDTEVLLTKLVGCRVDLTMNVSKDNMNYDELLNVMLQQLVCREYNVSWADIAGRRRLPFIVSARTAYCYLARTALGHTYTRIGHDINRDHTSVRFLYYRAQGFLDVGDSASESILKIKTELYENINKAEAR